MRRLLEVIFLGKPLHSNPGFMEKNCMQYPQGFFTSKDNVDVVNAWILK
jgi:hypothetical protein